MQADVMKNIIILSVVGAVIVFIVVTAVRMRIAERKPAEFEEEEDDRLYESKEAIPKLPRNETLYHIIKNNTLAVNKITFDPNYVFDEVASLLRNDVGETAVEVLYDISPDVPHRLIGSPKRLTRALLNLIKNAVQYSDNGIVLVQVSVLENKGVDCKLRFVIRDQGRGMSPEQIQSLKVDPQQRAIDGKTPYGYFVAHQIVVSDGGKMTVESVPDRGTTVIFDEKFKLPQTHSAIERWKPSSACASLRIALVVRHAQTAQVLKKHLETTVAEIMAMITEKPLINAKPLEGFDMVIIDHNLSDRELFYTLKKQGAVLVLLKSVLEQGSGIKHMAADYLLSVPFTTERLSQMLAIFYGEASSSVSAKKGTLKPYTPGTFINDSEIPVTTDVSKNDFEKFVGAKILVVEDNPINQRMVQGVLGESGMHLLFADNGQEALDIVAKEGAVDLVLMDINMPVLDGLETTRRLRNDPRFAAMPIVAFTGLNLKEQIETMKTAGLNAHMVKPLHIGRLYSVCEIFLSKENKRAGA